MTDSTHQLEHLGSWPAPFTQSFIETAADLLEHHGAVTIIGPPGSRRLSLATMVAEQRAERVVTVRCQHSHRKDSQWVTRRLARQLRVGATNREDGLVSSIAHIDPDRAPTVILADAEFADRASRLDLEVLSKSRTVHTIALLTEASAPWHSEVTERTAIIRLPPLDFRAVNEALISRFGLSVQPEVVQFLLHRSQGNYGVLQEVVAHALRAGTLAEIEGVLVHSREFRARDVKGVSIAPRSISRLSELDGASDLIDLVSLIGEVNYAEAIDCLGQRAVRSALKAGTVVEINDAITLASVAEADLVTLLMSVQRQRELYDRHAARLSLSLRRVASSIRSVMWMQRIDALPSGDLLLTATVQANLAGLYDRVIAWTDVPSDGRHTAGIERAYALREVGEIDAAKAWLDELHPEELAEDELLQYVRLRWIMGLDSWPADYQPDRSSSPPSRQARLVELAVLTDKVTRFNDDASIASLTQLSGDGTLTPLARVAALTALAYSHRSRAEIGAAVARAQEAVKLIESSETPVSASYSHPAHEALVMSLITAMDYPAATSALHQYTAQASQYGSTTRLGHCLSAFLELFRGEITFVLARSHLVVTSLAKADPHQTRSWMEAHFSQALAQAGRMREAQVHLALSLTLPLSHRAQLAYETKIAQACALDSVGDPEAALELLASVHNECRDLGLRLNQIDAAVLLVQMGGQENLPLLVDALEPLDEPAGTAAVWQQFARACAADECHTLYDMTHQLAQSGAVVISAEIAQFVLDQPRALVTLSDEERRYLDVIADPVSHRAL